MNSEDEDPFASIEKLCQISDSQQFILHHCLVARKLEVFSDDEEEGGFGVNSQENYEASEQVTGIVMVSLPETPECTSHSDEYHTPPEEAQSLVSSQEQHVANADLSVGASYTDCEKAVDLSKDSDLGFSELQTVPLISEVQGYTSIVGHRCDHEEFGPTCEDTEGIVEVGKDVEAELMQQEDEFTVLNPEKKLNVCVEDCANAGTNDSKVSRPDCAETEGIIEAGKDLEAELMQEGDEFTVVNPEKRLKVCVENLQFQEGSNAWTNDSEESEERIIRTVEDSESQRTNEVLGSELKQHHGVFNNENSATPKNIDDIEKFRYVGSSNTSHNVLRQLPPSILGQEKNVVSNIASVSTHAPDLLMNVLKMLAERCELKNDDDGDGDDDDILEVAMKLGMTFPRPSWWPSDYRPLWWPPVCGDN